MHPRYPEVNPLAITRGATGCNMSILILTATARLATAVPTATEHSIVRFSARPSAVKLGRTFDKSDFAGVGLGRAFDELLAESSLRDSLVHADQGSLSGSCASSPTSGAHVGWERDSSPKKPCKFARCTTPLRPRKAGHRAAARLGTMPPTRSASSAVRCSA